MEAATPRVVKVTAEPSANTREMKKAFFVFFWPVPPTYPTINGILDSAQGVMEVSIPANKARIGASQKFSFMSRDICSSKASNYFTPISASI